MELFIMTQSLLLILSSLMFLTGVLFYTRQKCALLGYRLLDRCSISCCHGNSTPSMGSMYITWPLYMTRLKL